jgi:hypothetical protein
MLVPEVEVKTIREAEDAGVGVGTGVGVGVELGVESVVEFGVEFGVEFSVDTDVDVVEMVLVEEMEELIKVDFWSVEEVGMVVAPPLSMLLKALAAPPRGFSLGSDAGPDNPVLPEFPPSKPLNLSMRSRR